MNQAKLFTMMAATAGSVFGAAGTARAQSVVNHTTVINNTTTVIRSPAVHHAPAVAPVHEYVPVGYARHPVVYAEPSVIYAHPPVVYPPPVVVHPMPVYRTYVQPRVYHRTVHVRSHTYVRPIHTVRSHRRGLRFSFGNRRFGFDFGFDSHR